MKTFHKNDLVLHLDTGVVGTVLSVKKRETQEKLGPWGIIVTHVVIRSEIEVLWVDGTVSISNCKQLEKIDDVRRDR